MKLKGLYAITDEKMTPYDVIDRYVAAAIDGGARIVQLRDKSNSDEQLYPVAKKLKKICKAKGALFILNDRVVLAKAVNSDGVHIGSEDTPIELAREILGKKKIIGVSCYGDIKRAEEMALKGASYLAFGSFFPSKTKPNSAIVPKEVLREAKRRISLPICAIGGIDATNGASLLDEGADMLSVISSLWSGDVTKNAAELSALWRVDKRG